MSLNSFAELCKALNAVEKNNQFVCKCPAHADSNPSLWMTERENKILLHCFAGCTQNEVIEALKCLNLWSDSYAVSRLKQLPAGIPYFYPPAAILKKQGLQPSLVTQKAYTAHYTYRNELGEVIGFIVRYDGHGKKDVIPYFNRWKDGNWRAGHASKDSRALYGLELVGVHADNSPVVFVEGEKCANALRNKLSGALIVTWPGGAKSTGKVDLAPLTRFREFVLWPDFDVPGYRAMQSICKTLEARGNCKISVVDPEAYNLPSLGAGSDCVDFIAAHSDYDFTNFLSNTLEVASPYFSKCIKQFFSKEKESDDEEPASKYEELTDDGNAARFVKQHGKTCKFTHELGWVFYDKARWLVDKENMALGLAIKTARTIKEEMKLQKNELRKLTYKWYMQSQSNRSLSSMLAVAKGYPGMTFPIEKFDAQQLKLTVLNGTVNLCTGTLESSNAEDYIMRQAPVTFDANADCPLWEAFLHRIMGGNKEMIEYLQRAIGYSLTGSCSEQVMFLLWGSGSNGKSVFLESLRYLLGDYGCSTSTDVLLLDAKGAAASGSNSIARLRGTRLVIGSEIPAGAKLNESRVKEMTGEDTISARFLYHEYFEFKPEFKLWVRSNHRPEISGNDQGIWRRLNCIPFNVQISDAEKDFDLSKKLRAEFPGILNWAIRGCLDWQRVGLKIPNEVINTTKIYRQDMDVIGEWLEECCDTSQTEKEVSAGALYSNFKEWSKRTGETLLSQRKLGLILRERRFFRVRHADGRYYKGITIKSEETPEKAQQNLELDKYNIFS